MRGSLAGGCRSKAGMGTKEESGLEKSVSFEGFDTSRHEAGIAKALSEATKGDDGMHGKRHGPFPATPRRCVGIIK
jgi:hypothetical protein